MVTLQPAAESKQHQLYSVCLHSFVSPGLQDLFIIFALILHRNTWDRILVLHKWLQAKGLFSIYHHKPCSVMWESLVGLNCIKKVKPEPVSQLGLVQSKLTGSPKGFNESLHFLRLSLHTNMSLELSQGFVELHAGKIHLIHNATVKEKTKRGEGSERERRVTLGLVVACHCAEKVCERARAVCGKLWVPKCWWRIFLL